jgi:hypothetical protein
LEPFNLRQAHKAFQQRQRFQAVREKERKGMASFIANNGSSQPLLYKPLSRDILSKIRIDHRPKVNRLVVDYKVHKGSFYFRSLSC